jgi:hypothetical protein
MKTFALAFFSAIALLVSACSDTMGCQDICKEQNTCSGATMRDCTALCAQISTLNASASCSAKYDEWRTCESSIVICSPATASCDDERTAWATCAGAFCAAHGTDMACASGTPML